MPSRSSRSQFQSTPHKIENGRKIKANGGQDSNGTSSDTDDHRRSDLDIHTQPLPRPNQPSFTHLSAPQQSLLLLHGPRQKYSLTPSQSSPQLTHPREILVQVSAIGSNPIDWKGPDYGFGQPSYPWVNGRDFAGIVVRTDADELGETRVRKGDVVFGPSTDYRDVRKAAYQEYVVTTDFNVARLPQGVGVERAASVGVAFVAAAVALGVVFGVEFAASAGVGPKTDSFTSVKGIERDEVPEDIRDEIFDGIEVVERPGKGDWEAVWGASTTTGQIVSQLAKLAGLRVAAVADVAKYGSHLSELGADFLVDKFDTKRAVEILRAVTAGRLRFGLDAVGKESAGYLQEALQQSGAGPKAHLLGLTGSPKEAKDGVVHHRLPIKIFHEAPVVGNTLMTWLEDSLITKTLRLPLVEVAHGGLSGINSALDRLRKGEVRGKRVVVQIGSTTPEPRTPLNEKVDGQNGTMSSINELEYAERSNANPERLKFAYWVPNVSGGLVISKIPQPTGWDLASNQRYARTAERVGFEYALSQIRFMAGYGAENQHEPVTFSQASLASTTNLKLIAALLPGPWNPAVAAKQIASISNYYPSRIAVNVVSGWFKAEFTSIGQWWLDHSERYRRSREFITCLKGIWTQETFTFKGDFYQFHEYASKPKPVCEGGREHPEIFQGGNSDDAKENAAGVSDYYFMNGNTLEGFQEQIRDVKARAEKAGRADQVKFASNGFVICRETEEEAIRVSQEIQGKADKAAVEGFRQQVQNAGASTGNKSGMWADSKFEDSVQYNDGFKTKSIGTRAQIADRILLLKSSGIDILLVAFLHYEDEIQQFGDEVSALVRQSETQGRGKDQEYEIRSAGDVYRKK